MKKIAIALLMFGLPGVVPIYLVIELRARVKANDQTTTDHHFEKVHVSVPSASQWQIETSFPFPHYPDIIVH